VRFLIDAQLPPGLARWLSARGHPSDHVHDLGLGAASDDEIEAKAVELQAVVWSKDSDFADRSRRAQGLQVVWIRFGNTSNASLQARIAPHLPTIGAALLDGEVLLEVR
jgi:predicted nuclease of predicted toxin-antitoxin system